MSATSDRGAHVDARRGRWLLLAVLLAGSPTLLAGQNVEDTTWVTPDGTRALRQRVVVDAPLDSVWRIYATPEGLRSVVAPVADIELEVGGTRSAVYDPAGRIGDPGTIVNEILTYLPREMFSLRVRRAPADFPYPGAVKELWTVVELDETLSGSVRVTATMLGFGEGPPWDALLEAFRQGNATELRRLARRFETGPVNWEEVFSGASPSGG